MLMGNGVTPARSAFDRGTIAISYVDDGVAVCEGNEVEPGHFKLSTKGKKGRATLHRFRDDDVLDAGGLRMEPRACGASH